MAAARTIRVGGLVTKDPHSIEVYAFDWDLEHLPASVGIASQSFVIAGPDAVLTKDSEDILTAGEATTLLGRTVSVNSRVTQVRLTAGTIGAKYTVTNRIVTNEAVAQTKDASFQVLIQER